MSAERTAHLKGTAATPSVSLCELEPIHIPGAIQPHGALLAAQADGQRVTHASANLAAILGYPPEAVLGRSLEAAVGEAACRAWLSAGSDDGAALGPAHVLPGPHGGTIQMHAHRSGTRICVDIEPMRADPGKGSPVTLVQSVLETFKGAKTRGELAELAVRGLKRISGYDRVMAYRFADDGHGEVIAEACAAELAPFLGLRYPAADVPAQARRQYLRQRVGAIADSAYRPVPLLSTLAFGSGTPLDLTRSALRSVSPLHLEYMRNMNTAASLTVGLAHEGALWGMLVCHHGTARIAGPDLRGVADVIGQVVSLLLGSLGEAENYAQRLARNAILRGVVEQLAAPVPLPDALADAEADLLALVGAAGAVVCVSGTLRRLGRTPAAAERALAVLQKVAGNTVLALDDLGLRYPELACCTGEGSGALLLPLAQGTDDAILWFRPEVSRNVAWGGNPAEHATSDPVTGRLSPRASFSAWIETVNGRSAPWVAADIALARELRIAVEMEVAQRTKAELARLRHYDALTGLPNRSLLQDRLIEVQRETGAAAALLFLDLDRFKAVNDTLGHAAGDALLVEVARRLVAAAAPENMAVRLGGDEFVVLCPRLDRGMVADLVERIRQALERPFEIAGRPCHISASIGVAMSDQSCGFDLIRAADMAMYAAKRCGGNRGVLFESSLFDQAAQQFQLEHDLREALAHGDQFALLYQPLFGLNSGSKHLVGFEALLRWRHPRHGWMSPAQFIPLAEKSGLIQPLGDWVLTTALHQGRGLRLARPDAELQINVNISALQLPQPGFCSGLAGALEAEGFPPSALCLEVTETILADVTAASVLADIRKLGVRVAIDDFGVGYSSLSYLRRLPVDIVKLDRAFLDEVEGDPSGAAFLKALIALGHAAGLAVVLEGIETQVHFDLAVAAHADVVQGFFFAPPLSENAARDLVAQHRNLDARPASEVASRSGPNGPDSHYP